MKRHFPRASTWKTHLLALLGAGLLAAVASTVFGQAGTAGEPPPPPICERWHRGSGTTDSLDVREIERSYREVKSRFDKAVAETPKDLEKYLERPHRTGLPACRSRQSRELPLKTTHIPGLSGKVYYFASPDGRGSLRLPREVRSAQPDAVFILELGKIAQLHTIARSTGKPTYLASRQFADALGVRCSGTLVRISEKGDALRIDEGL